MVIEQATHFQMMQFRRLLEKNGVEYETMGDSRTILRSDGVEWHVNACVDGVLRASVHTPLGAKYALWLITGIRD